MSTYYLAVDIDVLRGCHVLFHLEDGKMMMEEVYRFENRTANHDGTLCWDLDRLYQEVLTGLKKCREIGKIPYSMGIDAWGMDFVLLDENDQIIGDAVSYLDKRTDGMDAEVYKLVSQEQLYARTGIRRDTFNTVYQLMALKKQHPEQLEQARTLLFIPDYLNFLLTGSKVCEYTNATTGQLVSSEKKNWDYDLIDMLGYPREIFQKIIMPGTRIGSFRDSIRREVGYDLQVVAPATHNTSSAVLAVPAADDDFIFISSGTWSFIGVERRTPDCSEKSCEMNFTNEGGYAGRFRYMKNVEELWMIQEVQHEFHDEFNLDEICVLARAARDFPSRIDVKDARFFNPDSMTEAVQEYCRSSGQQVPESIGEIAAVIYASVAQFYARIVQELEEMSGREFHRIHIIGDGCKNDFLNELTAMETGRRVHVGPTAAAAIGNAAAQMLRAGEFNSIEDVRACIHDSFDIKLYVPDQSAGKES